MTISEYSRPGTEGYLWKRRRKTIESGTFANFAKLKKSFNAIDRVGNFYVFDIAGNKFRLIAAVHFNTQKLFVRAVLTHQEYDKWVPRFFHRSKSKS